MLKTFAYATLLSTALVGSTALAADNSSAQQIQPTQAPSGINFVTSQDKDQWRAPKLIGVAVYGPDGKQMGTIDDILMDHDGKAQSVVIGVGGFLGIGKKDVAVPFSAIQWKMEPRRAPANAPGNSSASNNGQTAGIGQTAGNGQTDGQQQANPAVAEASQGYPDRAILNANIAELKAAPNFQYAENPVTTQEARPAAGGQPDKNKTP